MAANFAQIRNLIEGDQRFWTNFAQNVLQVRPTLVQVQQFQGQLPAVIRRAAIWRNGGDDIIIAWMPSNQPDMCRYTIVHQTTGNNGETTRGSVLFKEENLKVLSAVLPAPRQP
jgi:hypothetical protein